MPAWPLPGPVAEWVAPDRNEPKKIDKARKLYDSRQHTVAEIAEMLHVSVATIYRHLDQTQAVSVSP